MNKKLLFLIFFVFLISLSCVRGEFAIQQKPVYRDDGVCYTYDIIYTNEDLMDLNAFENFFVANGGFDEPWNRIFITMYCQNIANYNTEPTNIPITKQKVYVSGQHREQVSSGNITTIKYNYTVECNGTNEYTYASYLLYNFNHGDMVRISQCDLIDPTFSLDIVSGLYLNGSSSYTLDDTSHNNNFQIRFPTAFSKGSCDNEELTNKQTELNNSINKRTTFQVVTSSWVNLIQFIYTFILIVYWIIRISVLLFGMFVLFKAVTYLYNKIKRLLE